MIEPDDKILVRQCLRGDIKAFESLVDKYQKVVFNVAYRIANDFDDAEDITQSVFIKAFERLGDFNPRYKFFSWIYRIALNESINHANLRKHGEELNESLASDDGTPEESYRQSELCDQVQKALMKLPVDYRVVVVLKHFQNLSYDEISYVLDIPERTVKSRLFSARNSLRDILLKKGITK